VGCRPCPGTPGPWRKRTVKDNLGWHVLPHEFRDEGRRTVDMLAAYLESVERNPLFPRIAPKELQALFDEPLPLTPTPFESLLREIEQKLLPYSVGVNHPGYFGLMTPTPTSAGILGDFIASALNQNLGTYSIGPAAVTIERQTLRWLTDLAGYGPGAGGNLTSGGTMANMIALKLARDRVSGDQAQRRGARNPMAVYVSEERHVSVDKAVDVVGLGRDSLRTLPTDDSFALRLDALEAAIARDKEAGIRPACIVGIAGTTSTGSMDPLPAIAAVAAREGAWFHVDAAYGGGLLLSERRRGLLQGLPLADSIALDPHKWFFAPLDAGALLVKDAGRLTASFGLKPSYLTDELDHEGERYLFYVHGFEQSRRFRALKIWMSFKRYGARQIGRWIDSNIEQIERLYGLCAASAELKPVCKPVMAGLCVRYLRPGLSEGRLARIHHEAARRVEEEGRFWISTTVLKGRTAFRINPVNIRTRPEHMDELFETLRRECTAAV
jgi:aromatic-L-amino-acid decarboxylase